MYLVLWRDNSYFFKPTPKNCSETDVIKMLEFLIDNIPAALAYYVYISPLIRYSSVSGSYHDVLDRRLLLTWKLLNQGFLVVELNSRCICVTNDHWCVPFVVITIRSFPHLWLFTGLVTRVTCQVSLLTPQ